MAGINVFGRSISGRVAAGVVATAIAGTLGISTVVPNIMGTNAASVDQTSTDSEVPCGSSRVGVAIEPYRVVVRRDQTGKVMTDALGRAQTVVTGASGSDTSGKQAGTLLGEHMRQYVVSQNSRRIYSAMRPLSFDGNDVTDEMVAGLLGVLQAQTGMDNTAIEGIDYLRGNVITDVKELKGAQPYLMGVSKVGGAYLGEELFDYGLDVTPVTDTRSSDRTGDWRSESDGREHDDYDSWRKYLVEHGNEELDKASPEGGGADKDDVERRKLDLATDRDALHEWTVLLLTKSKESQGYGGRIENSNELLLEVCEEPVRERFNRDVTARKAFRERRNREEIAKRDAEIEDAKAEYERNAKPINDEYDAEVERLRREIQIAYDDWAAKNQEIQDFEAGIGEEPSLGFWRREHNHRWDVYNADATQYNADVEAWNASDRTDQGWCDRLNAEYRRLNDEYNFLTSEDRALEARWYEEDAERQRRWNVYASRNNSFDNDVAEAARVRDEKLQPHKDKRDGRIAEAWRVYNQYVEDAQNDDAVFYGGPRKVEGADSKPWDPISFDDIDWEGIEDLADVRDAPGSASIPQGSRLAEVASEVVGQVPVVHLNGEEIRAAWLLTDTKPEIVELKADSVDAESYWCESAKQYYCGLGMAAWTGDEADYLMQYAKEHAKSTWWNLDYQVSYVLASPVQHNKDKGTWAEYAAACRNSKAGECAAWVTANWSSVGSQSSVSEGKEAGATAGDLAGRRAAEIRMGDGEDSSDSGGAGFQTSGQWEPNRDYGRSALRLAETLGMGAVTDDEQVWHWERESAGSKKWKKVKDKKWDKRNYAFSKDVCDTTDVDDPPEQGEVASLADAAVALSLSRVDAGKETTQQGTAWYSGADSGRLGVCAQVFGSATDSWASGVPKSYLIGGTKTFDNQARSEENRSLRTGILDGSTVKWGSPDVALAAVLRWTGTDIAIPAGPTKAQQDYLEARGDTWMRVGTWSPSASGSFDDKRGRFRYEVTDKDDIFDKKDELVPGDVLIIADGGDSAQNAGKNKGAAAIYVGESNVEEAYLRLLANTRQDAGLPGASSATERKSPALDSGNYPAFAGSVNGSAMRLLKKSELKSGEYTVFRWCGSSHEGTFLRALERASGPVLDWV